MGSVFSRKGELSNCRAVAISLGYWPLGTVVIAGPKVLDFYAGFCAHRATCLKADGKDIKVLNLILSGNSDDASETDPSKGLKPEK